MNVMLAPIDDCNKVDVEQTIISSRTRYKCYWYSRCIAFHIKHTFFTFFCYWLIHVNNQRLKQDLVHWWDSFMASDHISPTQLDLLKSFNILFHKWYIWVQLRCATFALYLYQICTCSGLYIWFIQQYITVLGGYWSVSVFELSFVGFNHNKML